MDCEIARQNLLDYSRRQLRDSEEQRIREHLDGCEGCRLFLEEEQAFHCRLSSLPIAAPSTDVWARVEQATERRRRGVGRLLEAMTSPRRIATATIMVVLIAALLVVAPFRHQRIVEHETAVNRIVQQQVESQMAQKWTDDPLGSTTDHMLAVIMEEL